MQNKSELNLARARLLTQLNLARARLLTNILFGNKYDFKNKDFHISYIPPYVQAPEGLKPGLVSLDNKIIAEIITHVVTNIYFNGRYDPLIRYFMEALEVELHRFGSAWIGYPNSEPIDVNNDIISLAMTLTEEELKEEARKKKEKEKTDKLAAKKAGKISEILGNNTDTITYGIDYGTLLGTTGRLGGTTIGFGGTTGGTSGAIDGTTWTTTTSTIGNYIFNDISNYTIATSAYVEQANNFNREQLRNTLSRMPTSAQRPTSNPPRDPRIAAAQQAGMSQRQINEIVTGRRGRR